MATAAYLLCAPVPWSGGYKGETTMKHYTAAMAIALSACATTGVIPMDKDTYILGKRSAQLGFGPPVGAKAEVYEEANAFCAKQSRSVETVSFESVDSGFARPGSVSLQFRCVTK